MYDLDKYYGRRGIGGGAVRMGTMGVGVKMRYDGGGEDTINVK